jgi:hypothetical protein
LIKRVKDNIDKCIAIKKLTLKETKTFYKFIPDKLVPEVPGLLATLLVLKSKKRSYSNLNGHEAQSTLLLNANVTPIDIAQSLKQILKRASLTI